MTLKILSDSLIKSAKELCEVEPPFEHYFDNNFVYKILNTIEAKDTQIKQLVEALEKSKWPQCDQSTFDEMKLPDLNYWARNQNKKIDEALSNIPDMESYRLEQEVIKAVGLFDESPSSALQLDMRAAYRALKAHNESRD